MNVKELRDILDELPDDSLVVMSRDGEGNGFSPLSDLDDCMYVADSTWSGELWSEDPEGQDDDPMMNDPPPENAVRAVCLWPVN